MPLIVAVAVAVELTLLILGAWTLAVGKSSETAPAKVGRSRLWRISVGQTLAYPMLGLALALVLTLLGLTFGGSVAKFFAPLLSWINHSGPFRSLLFTLLYVVVTLLFLPASLLSLAAGACFGLWQGMLQVVVAATLAANLAFGIGRYWARQRLTQLLADHPNFRAIDRAMGQAGWRLVTLIRLSPLFPFSLLNYALGLTPISLRDNLMGLIGILPGAFLYVYIGSLLGDLSGFSEGIPISIAPEAEILGWWVRGVGLVATVAVTLFLTHMARQALQEANLVPEPTAQNSNPESGIGAKADGRSATTPAHKR